MNRLILSQLIAFPLMFFGGLGALYAFFVTSTGFVQDYLNEATYIVYDRRLWAMLGFGVGLLGIVAMGAGELVPKIKRSHRVQRISATLMVGGIVLMFGLPFITSLVEGPLLKKRGYLYCEQATYPYHLPGFGEKNYVKNSGLCLPSDEFREQLDRYRENKRQ